MGLSTTLQAKPRQTGSSNKASRLRAQGFLPATFYGPKMKEPQSLTLEYSEFKKAYLGGEGNRSLYTLAIEGQGTMPVLLKDFQVDPLSRKVIHADFYMVDPEASVTVEVPLVLVGKPAGVEKGGQLQQSAREIMISAKPENVPSCLEVNVSKLALGQALHFSQVEVPEGVKLAYKVDLAVATVAVPKGLKAEAGEAEAAETEKKK